MPVKRYNIASDKHLQALLMHLRGRSQPFNIAISEGQKRSIDQNRRMWAMLNDVSQNATHQGQQYSAENWKVLFMIAMGQELRLAPALDGKGLVPLSTRSSEMTIAEMADLMTFIEAWCAENGVILTDPRLGDERNAA